MIYRGMSPLRISFVGGGTDHSFFSSVYGGCVIGAAINKYVRVCVSEDTELNVYYEGSPVLCGFTESVLAYCAVDSGLRVDVSFDIPLGAGLGCSSALLVALLAAVYSYLGYSVTPEILAQKAYHVESVEMKRSVGCQDFYLSSCGGLRQIFFNTDGTVIVESVPLCDTEIALFSDSLLLFNTGLIRDSSALWSGQSSSSDIVYRLLGVKDLVSDFYLFLLQGDFAAIGYSLHSGWMIKKSLSVGVTNLFLDSVYQVGLDAGAYGGKLLGAGGGGFFLFCVAPEYRQSVVSALTGMGITHLPFDFCV